MRAASFFYEKLFAVKALAAADERNCAAGKETSEDRRRRLFYVICTRVEKSLALVAYTGNPGKLNATVISKGWFEPGEVVVL